MLRISIFTILTLFVFACGSGGSEGENSGEESNAPGAVEQPAEPQGRVFFVEPLDGDTVISPVAISMGVEGMEVKPAGQVVEGEGHHHIIVDGDFIPAGTIVPSDATHIHYGDGATDTTLVLTPGPHTLTMQFADGVHTSLGEDWSSTITVYVEADESAGQ